MFAWDEQNITALLRMRSEGRSLREMSKELGVARSSLTRRLWFIAEGQGRADDDKTEYQLKLEAWERARAGARKALGKLS